ncbi:uncharacterized protein LOC119582330 [Penaeus monodon]|uniref:uncharacterized protein LOC119582330 n=1 Tax=Penaeus monodon TaxID=6687 RepID=UPI0018A7CB89|nr:uncharacterized protein LOC119582330 [Penaeus monodon]
MWLTSIAVVVAVTWVLTYSPEAHAATLDLNPPGEEPHEYGVNRHRRALASDTFASPGNIVYSVVSFIMAGSLLFVNLFDPFRLAVIRFFDAAFGPRTERRRKHRQVIANRGFRKTEELMSDVMRKYQTPVLSMPVYAIFVLSSPGWLDLMEN